MNKNEAIHILNNQVDQENLSNINTHWSNLVEYRNDIGWWLNIPFHKFDKDLYLILNDKKNSCFYTIKLPANSISSPENIFRNKNGTADIFMPSSGQKRMIDTQSGSSEFDFNDYQFSEIKY